MGAVQPPARPGGVEPADSADMTASVTPRRSARIAAATGAASRRTVTPRRSARVASAVTHASSGVPDSAASARGPRRSGPASVPRRPLRVQALAPGRVDPRMRTRASRLTPAAHVSEMAADVELNEDGSRVYQNSRGRTAAAPRLVQAGPCVLFPLPRARPIRPVGTTNMRCRHFWQHPGRSSSSTSHLLPRALRGLLDLSLPSPCPRGSVRPRVWPPPTVQLRSDWRCPPR